MIIRKKLDGIFTEPITTPALDLDKCSKKK